MDGLAARSIQRSCGELTGGARPAGLARIGRSKKFQLGRVPPASPGDIEEILTRHRTYWSKSVDYAAHCADRFPLTYGASLVGEPMRDWSIGRVSPEPLLPDIEYYVSANDGCF